MKQKKIAFILFWALLIFLVFRFWFSLKPISAGDLGFFYPQNGKQYWQVPLAWESFRNAGLGGYALPFQHWYPANLLLGFFSQFLNFALVERLIWFLPILTLSFLTSWYLAKTFKFSSFYALPLIWLILFLNTYFLMIVAGGQITIALAYALLPLVFSFLVFLLRQEKVNLRQVLTFCCLLTLLAVFDLRFLFLFSLIAFFYFVFLWVDSRFSGEKLIFWFKKYLILFLPASLTFLFFHAYWLLPWILFPRSPLPPGYGETGWLEFLSFADFSHSLSLLHPNWPEGIFGKTYFMRPEFLLLPILAFIGLWFVKKEKKAQAKSAVLFSAFLILIGAFLSKGVKPPGRIIYTWFFNYFPGGSMFRDPTKFYILVALGYSVLIPYTIFQLARQLTGRPLLKKTFLVLVFAYFLFLVKPAVLGQLRGVLKPQIVPSEYLQLAEFIDNQDQFFRTFWVPKTSRFTFWTDNHPAISAEEAANLDLFPLTGEIDPTWADSCLPNEHCYPQELAYLSDPETFQTLSRLGVKYLIIPLDSTGEIFQAERNYSAQQAELLESFIDTIPGLKKLALTEKMAVYQLPQPQDRFFVLDKPDSKITWQMIRPTEYLLEVKNATQPLELIFSENYDPLWQAKIGEKTISPQNFNQLNSFPINQTGDLTIKVQFKPQAYVYGGIIISLLALSAAGFLVFSFIRRAFSI